jgi:Protein of unknown function (DUF2934)
MWLIHQFDSLLNLGICKEYPIMAKAKTPRNSAGKPDSTSVATPAPPAAQPETISEIREVRKVTPDVRKNVVPINLDEEIRRRAYELWEQHGRESGREKEHWLLAETEMLARYRAQRQQSA